VRGKDAQIEALRREMEDWGGEVRRAQVRPDVTLTRLL
jgi:hypothetical protein